MGMLEDDLTEFPPKYGNALQERARDALRQHMNAEQFFPDAALNEIILPAMIAFAASEAALSQPAPMVAQEAQTERGRQTLKEIAGHAKMANDVVRLGRGYAGNGRVKVATCLHHIERLANAALAQPAASAGVREALPDDLFTHQHSWRAALVRCAERAACAGDEADQSYYNHEIDVFDRVYASLNLTGMHHKQNATDPTSETNDATVAGEGLDSFKQPYADAGHNVETLFVEGGGKCDRCRVHLIDLAEDMSYGEMRKCLSTQPTEPSNV